jgi:hypothetical protein
MRILRAEMAMRHSLAKMDDAVEGHPATHAGGHAEQINSWPICSSLPWGVVTQWRLIQGGLCRTCC